MKRADSKAGETSLLFCVADASTAPIAVPLLQLLLERRVFTDIHVAISEHALTFVRQEPLAILSRRKCVTNVFDEAIEGRTIHAELAERCQIALIAPASANVIAKLAHGFADDTVTILMSVFGGTRVVVPAVAAVTRRQPSFQRNLSQLAADGFHICDRESDRAHSLAGAAGTALMPAIETVVTFLQQRGSPHSTETHAKPLRRRK